ncbi:MAG: acyl-CoA thioesterase [Haloechinothrix sp.]
MRSYLYRHVVTLDETNLVGNVYFAHYLHWQGHCRERFLADHAPGVLTAVTAGDLILVTVSCAMNFYAECFALDEIEIAMSLRSANGNRIVMDFDFRCRHQLAAQGTQTVACMRRTGDGTTPVEIPADLATALRAFT